MFRSVFALALVVAFQAASAEEYPRVVHTPDGRVCVQSLEGDKVVESCRAEDAPGAARAATVKGPSLVSDQRNASLLEDRSGGRRVGLETFGAVFATAAVSAFYVANCYSSVSCGVGQTLGVTAGQIALTGLVAGLLHLANDGQAGFGWGLLGATLGGVGSVLVGLIALAAGGAAGLIIAPLVGLLPAIGAVIALEARDTAVRESPQGVAALLDVQPSLTVTRF